MTQRFIVSGRNIIKKSVVIALIFSFGSAVSWGAHLFFTVSLPLTKADALVVFAGKYEERIPAAIFLYNAGYSNHIILTNGGPVETWYEEQQTNLPEIVCSEKLLLKNGIPQHAIIKLPFYRSGTVYDVRAVRTYLASHPVKSLLLVTSDYHAKRSLWIFKRVLKDMPVTVTVAPVKSGWSSTVPILLEPIKTVYYWVRYGLLEQP